MNLRARMLLASLLLVLVPLMVLMGFLRRGMTDRLTTEYTLRAETLMEVIEEDLADTRRELRGRLEALRNEIIDDNSFRLAAVEELPDYRQYLLDYAGRTMPLQGLSLLQIQDSEGQIVSSGHFRNEYGRLNLELPQLLAATPDGSGFMELKLAEGNAFAFVAVDSLTLASEQFHLVAGVIAGREFLTRLARERDLAVTLVYPHGAISSDPQIENLLLADSADSLKVEGDVAVQIDESTDAEEELNPNAALTSYLRRELEVPFLRDYGDEAGRYEATLLVSYPLSPLHALLRNLDLWLIILLAATAFFTMLLAFWFSRRISQPLEALASKTATLDLDKLDADFTTTRRDEVGVLSRFLDSMTHRLRASVQKLQQAERRATLGEVSRQVNHDIKNGLTPIRNTFRHLTEVSTNGSGRLEEVFDQRSKALESSISYLEALAANYARLSTSQGKQSCNVSETAREVTSAMRTDHGPALTLDLASNSWIKAEPIGLRRILENLIRNAQESVDPESGEIWVKTARITDAEDEDWVRLTVQDNGKGIDPRDQERILDDFYTTKALGIGLGLSIVRRLVSDFEGRIDIESRIGDGATFVIDFPADAHRAKNQG
ncbi:MAG: HAMP domain-containing protein [Candidatus Eisenbacteria bacterium]|uniref:histidine kinase n=1 Tax=Eiseniibacteriota bacterium TaxID=2212470 RepID=A0A7Y2H2P0_UNCEI|nr:HAMP domain-containing protein [Candidatus Eisenbacteria bacterium]